MASPRSGCTANRCMARLAFLKDRTPSPYKMLYDLTAIDERTRTHRLDEPHERFHRRLSPVLFRAERIYSRQSRRSMENALSLDTITDLWPAANWYEREVWDMFGITFSRPSAPHPHSDAADLGRASAAERPSGASDGDGTIPACRTTKQDAEQEALRFRPEEWGMQRAQRRQRLYFPECRPAASGHARRAAHRACSSTAKRSWTACPRSASTIAAPRRWASGRAGIPTFHTPTASTISAA